MSYYMTIPIIINLRQGTNGVPFRIVPRLSLSPLAAAAALRYGWRISARYGTTLLGRVLSLSVKAQSIRASSVLLWSGKQGHGRWHCRPEHGTKYLAHGRHPLSLRMRFGVSVWYRSTQKRKTSPRFLCVRQLLEKCYLVWCGNYIL